MISIDGMEFLHNISNNFRNVRGMFENEIYLFSMVIGKLLAFTR